MRNQTKTVSIVIIGIIYLIAILLGYFVFMTLNKGLHELVALFLADVVATIIVWFFGLIHKCVGLRPLLERGASCHFHRLGFLQVSLFLSSHSAADCRVVLGHPFDRQLGLYFQGPCT